jgi:hypothetical protein
MLGTNLASTGTAPSSPLPFHVGPKSPLTPTDPGLSSRYPSTSSIPTSTSRGLDPSGGPKIPASYS